MEEWTYCMDDLSGQLIKGYELKERIGVGGFGAVYRAYQPLLKREVAVKVILPEYANDPEFIRRFEVEAELVAQLEHPHIIPLFDYWREPDGAYLVMRWIRGGSLRDLLEKQDTWDAERSLQLLDHITAALHVAHRNGVVHRDIKPDNILLDEDSNAYLADFGIAKSPSKESKSGDDGVTGSLMYASPEQLQSLQVTPQTDIYSLGIVLYELLKGRHPFEGATLSELIFKHLQDPFPELRLPDNDLSYAINEVLQKATAKDPSERFSDVRELAAAFRAVISSDVISTPALSSDLYDDVDLDNPYKGLRAFQEYDSSDFFGRDPLTERLLKRLEQNEQIARFLAVVGSSGSGKSSIVKAGVIPALRRGILPNSDKWFIVEMFPGARPFVELEAALLRVAVNPPASLLEQLQGDDGISRAIKRILPPDDNTELLLIIDQFEELFTLTEDEAIRSHFLDSLLGALEDPHSKLRVIVTLRADFYDKPLGYVDFAEVMRKRTEVVVPLTPAQLEESITKPAEQIGAIFESGLVQTIINDIGEQPGILPLLQYALTELFEQRHGHVLTQKAYNDIGGVIGALARRAEEIFTDLTNNQQESSRQLFMRLVTLGEGTEDTRRRVKLSEVTLNDTSVMDKYGNARLLTFDRDSVTRGPTIEVAHEALIRTWERLKEWIASSRDDLRTHRRLTQATNEWLESGKNTGFLAQAGRLTLFEEWSHQTQLALNDDEQAYLKDSIAEREVRQKQEDERNAHELDLQRQSASRLRYLAIVLSVSTVIAILLSLFAFNAQKQADKDAQRAVTAERNAINAASTSVANAARATHAQGESLDNALTSDANAATATHALGISEQQGTEIAQQAATSDANLVEQWRTQALFLTNLARQELERGAWNNALNLALESLEHRDHFTLDQSHQVLSDVLDANGQEQLFLPYISMTYIAWNNDGSHFLAGNSSEMIIVDAKTGEEVVHVDFVSGIFDEIDPAIYDSFGDELVMINTIDGDRFSFDEENFPIPVQARDSHLWSHDRSAILEGVDWIDLSIVDATTFLTRFVLRHPYNVHDAIWNKDDSQILSYSEDGTVFVWDAKTGEQLFLLRHIIVINGALWNADETRIVTWTENNGENPFIYIWDAATGELLRTINQMDDIDEVSWNSVGNQILVQSRHDVRVWDVETGEELLTLLGDGGNSTFDGTVWNTDDSLIMTISYLSGDCIINCQHEVRIWDATTGLLLHRLQHEDNIENAIWNSDETLILSWAQDNTARIWDARTGNLYLTFRNSSRVREVMWSPDESQVLIRTQDGLQIWDSIPVDERHSNSINGAVWYTDEKQVLSWSRDNTARIWDTETGEQEFIFQHERGIISADVTSAIWNADESQVITTGWDSAARVWDANTGEQLLLLQRPYGSIVYGAQWSADESKILTWSGDDTVRVWDAVTGEEIQNFTENTERYDGLEYPMLSSDENRLLTTNNMPNNCEDACNHHIIIWDTTTGEELTNIAVENPLDPNQASFINGKVWNKDETRIMVWYRSGFIYVWDSETGEEIVEIEHRLQTEESSTPTHNPTPTSATEPSFSINGARWNYDETQIMSWSNDRHVELWDTTTGTLILDIDATQNIEDALWNTDESRILVRVANGIIVWDAITGEMIHSFEPFKVNGANWHSDGRRILLWGEGGIAVWDSEANITLVSLRDDGSIVGASWSEDESKILTWSATGNIRVWAEDIELLIQNAEKRQLRTLNNEDREQNFLATQSPTATNLPPTNTPTATDITLTINISTPVSEFTLTPTNFPPPSRTHLPTLTPSLTPTLDIPFTPIIPPDFDGLDLANSATVTSINADEAIGNLNPWGTGTVNIVSYRATTFDPDRTLVITQGLSAYQTFDEWLAGQPEITKFIGQVEETEELTVSALIYDINDIDVLEIILITDAGTMYQYFFIMDDIFFIIVDVGDNTIQLVEMLITGTEIPATPTPTQTPLPDLSFTPLIPDTSKIEGTIEIQVIDIDEIEKKTLTSPFTGDSLFGFIILDGSQFRSDAVIEGLSAYDDLDSWLSVVNLSEFMEIDDKVGVNVSFELLDINGVDIAKISATDNNGIRIQYHFIINDLFVIVYGFTDDGSSTSIALVESIIEQANDPNRD